MNDQEKIAKKIFFFFFFFTNESFKFDYFCKKKNYYYKKKNQNQNELHSHNSMLNGQIFKVKNLVKYQLRAYIQVIN